MDMMILVIFAMMFILILMFGVGLIVFIWIKPFMPYIMAKLNCDFGPLQELTINVEDTEYKGKDILSELHKKYFVILSALNKKVIFTDTYNS